MPSLSDSFFHHAVVYLCEHDEQGAMGLIINRPSKVMLDELLDHLKIDNNIESLKSMPVMFGGPVNKEQGMVLHDHAGPWKTTAKLATDVYLTTSTDILKFIGTEQGPEHNLITLGYAGWGAGQLEQELAENSWLTVKADHRLLFETPTDQRWHAAAQKLGIDINLMSSNVGHA